MLYKGILQLLLLVLLAFHGVNGQAAESDDYQLMMHLIKSMQLNSIKEEPKTTEINDYHLGTGDSIRIVVFQNPDFTADVQISATGFISYPLIGEVELGGLTIVAAEKKIAELLKDGGFLQQPQVNISLTQIRSSQVSVLGQVNGRDDVGLGFSS